MSDNLYKKKSLLNMAMLKNFLSKATKKRCSFIVNFPVDREWLHPFKTLTYFTLSGPYQEVVTGGTRDTVSIIVPILDLNNFFICLSQKKVK